MQVNMGEGKSSVIIPIVAAALADGKQLVRVIVPKALTVQMSDLLIARLGGFANRPIYYLPFSRTPESDYCAHFSFLLDDLHKLMVQCMTDRGILLLQPEHVMSLKLKSVEEQMRPGNVTTDPSMTSKYKRLIDQYIKIALSSGLVSMDTCMRYMY